MPKILVLCAMIVASACLESRKSELLIRNATVEILTADDLILHANRTEHLSLIEVPRLASVEVGCFAVLPLLRSIYIWRAPLLKSLPRNALNPAPPHLRSLRIINSGLEELPDLTYFNKNQLLHIIDFESNSIKKLRSRAIKVRVDQFLLDNNLIEEIEEYSFDGSELAELSLKGNMRLKTLHELSFAGIIGIRELDVSSTSITHITANGLETMEILRAQNTISLKTVPSIHDLKNLKLALLTHHFHCCAFQFPERHNPIRHKKYLDYATHMKQSHKQNIQLCSRNGIQNVTSAKSKRSMGKRKNKMKSDNLEHFSYLVSSSLEGNDKKSWSDVILESEESYDGEKQYGDDDFFDEGTFHAIPVNSSNEVKIICDDYANILNGNERWHEVECWPKADPLNPCEDVLGGIGARALGWTTSIAATLGNLAVTAVLVTRPLVAPRLLLLQLAIADLGTALYLLLIASVDTYTASNYFNYAYDWQYGFGCRIAGFLAIWGAQASLLALAALTLERWLAITHALLPQRRLSLRGARILLLISIIYSVLLAAAPLFGASHYSSTSICLPMRRENWADTIYLGCLLSGGLFCLMAVIGCYCHIYLTLAKDTPRNSSISGDASVANKMAILIATHMACCVPVAVVGFGALIDHPILGVHGAKLLLVLIYPLNALADPFLYAILTHQFRRDLYLLLDRYGLCTKRAQQYKIPGVVGRERLSRLPNSNNVPRRPDGSLTTACEDLLV